MNSNAKKWIRALRSGKYKQGEDQLRSGDKFCCLGVACDLYAKAHGVKWEKFKSDGDDLFSFFKLVGKLPSVVQNWLGLTDACGVYSIDNQPKQRPLTESLADLNDDGFSFQEIAAIIESEPTGLFKKARVNRKKRAKT
jgi:hypothetical protein